MKPLLKTIGIVLLPMVVIVLVGLAIAAVDHQGLQFCIFIGGLFPVGVSVWVGIMHLSSVHAQLERANEMKKNELERIARDECYRKQ